MSLRTDLVAYLQEICTATTGLEDVRVEASVRDVGALSKPLLVVKTNALEKLPQAPRSQYVGTFTLTLVSPHQDIDAAEDDLEARLELLLPTLFTYGLNWESATQAAFTESLLCYDIAVTSIYKRED
jgi:hypothetical protein